MRLQFDFAYLHATRAYLETRASQRHFYGDTDAVFHVNHPCPPEPNTTR